MDTITGIAWAMLGAVFLGTFALPSKYIKNYQWENTWGAFFFFAMLIVPVGFAMLVVKDLWATYADIPWLIIFGVMGLSFLWGCGFCCWGYGLSMLGLSIGYSLTMGTMALVGSMVPFFLTLMEGKELALTTPDMVVLAGILVCIFGVAINGFAGAKREKSQAAGASGTQEAGKGKNVLRGIFVCILAGVLSSGLNIAFHIGNNNKAVRIGRSDEAAATGERDEARFARIARISEKELGNAPWVAGLSTWTLVFLGGAISSVAFSFILLCKNKTWKSFAAQGSGMNLLFAFIMAVGHFACIFFYGIGGWKLGRLGTSVGFAIFQSGSLIIGNGLGFLTGEWRGSSSQSKGWLYVGLAVLIGGIVVVSIGNAMGS
ncbi:MAG: L-rhamnose/proton symporter RhaT [Phycisphaerae bacterium]